MKAQDTINVTFSEKQFFEWITKNHPLAKQANLLTEKGKAKLKAARGNFDPYIDLMYQSKDLKGSRYYEYSQNALKIPTWVGVDIETGWDFADKNGAHFNEELYTSVEGTGYLGVSVPLAQGLLIDKRRAEVKKAKIFQQASEVERIVLLNNLLFDASQAYWNWVGAYYNFKLVETSEETAQQRLEAVKKTYFAGQMSGIDTVEAFLQVQSIQYTLNEAKVKFQNSTLLASNFLWSDQQQPLEIEKGVIPSSFDSLNVSLNLGVQDSIQSMIAKHPQLQLYNLKRQSLLVDKKFKADKLKPKLKLKYQLLSKSYTYAYTPKDYKVGLTFQFPLFLREARGNLAMTKIKIQEVELKLEQKNRELITKFRTTANKLQTITDQITLYEQAVVNYKRLLKAEETKMFYGQSSLFKVNSREQKLLNAQQKLNKLKVKYYQTKAKLAWISGQMSI
ncbi:MAG: TolC family protein [Cytophagales bacterium]|nr:TolC family protein [Cytophagales bacterium]